MLITAPWRITLCGVTLLAPADFTDGDVGLGPQGEVQIVRPIRAALVVETGRGSVLPGGAWAVVDPAQLAAEAGWRRVGLPPFYAMPSYNLGTYGGQTDVLIDPDTARLVLDSYATGGGIDLNKTNGLGKLKEISISIDGYPVRISDFSGLENVEKISAWQNNYATQIYDYPFSGFGTMRPVQAEFSGFNDSYGYGGWFNVPVPSVAACARLLNYSIGGCYGETYAIETILQNLLAAGLSDGYVNVATYVPYGFEYSLPNYIENTPIYLYVFEDLTLQPGESATNPVTGNSYYGGDEGATISKGYQINDAIDYIAMNGDYHTDNGDGTLTVVLSSYNYQYGYDYYSGYASSTPYSISYPSVEALQARGWVVVFNQK